MMNIKLITISMVFWFLILSCNNGQRTEPNIQGADTAQELDDAYIQKLYTYYYSNPKTQEQKESNIIVDYIIENKLVVERDRLGYFYRIEKASSDAKLPLLRHQSPVEAHYVGTFLDGKIFDSSRDRGESIKFKVGQMIHAWNHLLKKMQKGDKALLLTPSRLAYADRGFPGFVPPNTPLRFEIEVL